MPEKLRATRASEALESLVPPVTLTLLETWSRGAPEATVAREASESLERLKQRQD
jgi:hypothetical protein